MTDKTNSEYALVNRYSKKVFALNKTSTRIGRSTINNIRINHTSCSSYHASVTFRANIIWFHDFSNSGTYVSKRGKFNLVKNETVRIFENSRFQIANQEFKLIKIKNLKNDIIEIEDSDNEQLNSNEIRESDPMNKNDNNTIYHWKKQKIRDLILKSTENLDSSDNEINEQNNETTTAKLIKKPKKNKIKSKEFIYSSSDSDNDSQQVKMEISEDEINNSDDEHNTLIEKIYSEIDKNKEKIKIAVFKGLIKNNVINETNKNEIINYEDISDVAISDNDL